MKDIGIIVGLQLSSADEKAYSSSMNELKKLAEACEIEVVEAVIQKGPKIHARQYIGTGKIADIKELIKQHDATVAIFNHELSASQIRNLEEALDVAVIDRTSLILRIFAQRAKTKEAKIQVEIAQLQYALPRLKGANLYLGRQGGSAGARNRGLGETKLELDRRHILTKVAFLKKELATVQKQRNIQRNSRKKSKYPKVALVGYTNSGKSTVMNKMLELSNQNEEKKVLEKDMLFATLDTNTRNIHIENFPPFLLSDTVGFVSNLPHLLVEAFKSTLEEVLDADLLLHIVDASNSEYFEQIDITNETLKQIGAEKVPALVVYNKIDRIANFKIDPLSISAKIGTGFNNLLNHITATIYQDFTNMQLLVPYEDGALITEIKENGPVVSFRSTDDGYSISWMCPNSLTDKYSNYCVDKPTVR